MNDFMQRELIVTGDGSHTLFIPEINEHFHSVYGAVQESNHVFIRNGLLKNNKEQPVVLEIGFGTGLNVFLTLINQGKRNIRYFSVEKYPLTVDEYSRLNYAALISEDLQDLFLSIHQSEWNKEVEIAPGFRLTKIRADLTEFDFNGLPRFDLIYYDAFAPSRQPEMWNETIFSKIANHTSPHGIFVTYCAQGEVRRTLTRAGFKMQRIAGPPGKKEMLMGEKSDSRHSV